MESKNISVHKFSLLFGKFSPRKERRQGIWRQSPLPPPPLWARSVASLPRLPLSGSPRGERAEDKEREEGRRN